VDVVHGYCISRLRRDDQSADDAPRELPGLPIYRERHRFGLTNNPKRRRRFTMPAHSKSVPYNFVGTRASTGRERLKV